jgi:hypothetical protein
VAQELAPYGDRIVTVFSVHRQAACKKRPAEDNSSKGFNLPG